MQPNTFFMRSVTVGGNKRCMKIAITATSISAECILKTLQPNDL